MLTLGLSGCQSEEGIVKYSIPTEVPVQLRQGQERMLAAMVPQQDQVWFFKVTGPEAAIESIEETFRNFVTEVSFQGGIPQLAELPEGWQRAGEKPMRYASIDITTPGKQLDLSVSSLPRSSDWDGYVKMNVNRWRGQLGLPESEEKWGGGEPLEVAAAEGTTVWVDIVGNSEDAEPMSGMAPFAASTPSDARSTPPMMAPANDAPAAESSLDFEKPAGWREGRMTSMRMAAFDVGPPEAAAELTVIQASGDVRGNVARWMGQIRPGGVSDADVDAALAEAQELEVDGRRSQRFLLVGEDPDSGTAIDATIIPFDGGTSLFVKMTGPVQTVRAESEAIAAFLESLQL